MANLEALWVAGRCSPGKKVLAGQMSHYTHQRISQVLGLEFETVPATDTGILDVKALERQLQQGNVGTVVATVGTTGLGTIDPLPEIIALREKYGFRLHVDAAYGGYFILADQLDPAVRAIFDAIQEADSIVIDPHKHGLQPYGCGCVLFKDVSVGRYYKHESPYTYFSSTELHLGEISLECSRPGAAAVALWATQQLLPMTTAGEFADSLNRCLLAARSFWLWLLSSDDFVPLMEPQIDIVVYAAKATSSSASSERARAIFEEAAKDDLHLALAAVPGHIVAKYWPDLELDSESVMCLRSCLMKPEHQDWLGEITARLAAAAVQSPAAKN
jgi:glutamate/tyrosine decarboxylase-like PLP-dependent enzyme